MRLTSDPEEATAGPTFHTKSEARPPVKAQDAAFTFVPAGGDCHSSQLELEACMFGSSDPSAQVVLLLNGHSSGMDTWRFSFGGLADALGEAGYKIIGFDYRGMGRSKPGRNEAAPEASGPKSGVDEYDLDQCVDDAVAVLEGVCAGGAKPVVAHIVGVSWGSFLAQRMTILHPGRVRSLTLIGSALDVPAQGARMLSRCPLHTAMLGLHIFARGPARGGATAATRSHEDTEAEADAVGAWAGRLLRLSSTPLRGSVAWPWRLAEAECGATKQALDIDVATAVAAGRAQFMRGAVDWGCEGAKLQSKALDGAWQGGAQLRRHAADLVASGVGGRTLFLHGRHDCVHPVGAGRAAAAALGAAIAEWDGGHNPGWFDRAAWLHPLVEHIAQHSTSGSCLAPRSFGAWRFMSDTFRRAFLTRRGALQGENLRVRARCERRRALHAGYPRELRLRVRLGSGAARRRARVRRRAQGSAEPRACGGCTRPSLEYNIARRLSHPALHVV